MKLPIYQLDVFTTNIFEGNPAGVVVMEESIDQQLMQSIAMENNLPETAFIIKHNDGYKIRWFTPTVEVDLCGHATMAAGHVVLYMLETERNEVTFQSSKYKLTVSKDEDDDSLAMKLPAARYKPTEVPPKLKESLGKEPLEAYKSDDYMLVFETRQDIADMNPDFEKLKEIDCRGIIVTAPGIDNDFVSRFFAPAIGIHEDPVTGSAHTKLVPYWSKKLGKKELQAEQLSKRGGRIVCRNLGDEVELLGYARIYMVGTIYTK